MGAGGRLREAGHYVVPRPRTTMASASLDIIAAIGLGFVAAAISR
jgi:hypothetical protein